MLMKTPSQSLTEQLAARFAQRIRDRLNDGCQVCGPAAASPQKVAYSEQADGSSDHCCWRGESPVGLLFGVLVALIQLIQLVEQNGGIEFTVVAGAQSLHCLVDGVFVLVVEQVRDFSGPVLIGISIVSDSSANMTWSIVCT